MRYQRYNGAQAIIFWRASRAREYIHPPNSSNEDVEGKTSDSGNSSGVTSRKWQRRAARIGATASSSNTDPSIGTGPLAFQIGSVSSDSTASEIIIPGIHYDEDNNIKGRPNSWQQDVAVEPNDKKSPDGQTAPDPRRSKNSTVQPAKLSPAAKAWIRAGTPLPSVPPVSTCKLDRPWVNDGPWVGITARSDDAAMHMSGPPKPSGTLTVPPPRPDKGKKPHSPKSEPPPPPLRREEEVQQEMPSPTSPADEGDEQELEWVTPMAVPGKTRPAPAKQPAVAYEVDIEPSPSPIPSVKRAPFKHPPLQVIIDG